MQENLQRLIHAVNNGKMRGYEDYLDLPASSDKSMATSKQWIQYAIQKRKERYIAYYFQIDVNDLSIYEDVAIEEQNEYSQLKEALEYLVEKGADLTKFAPFKGQRPF
ncbi:hypothetical protein [Paenibacillus kandeliae]|uniref:hypothetical protein n=1 Tax=Paenibacillus kandeliae TaxID=3231269 RepID=UPI0034588CB6